MIHLGPTSPDLEAVARSTGFAWWYLDLVDSQGNGIVLIWSLGLPMTPGTAAAERAGTLPSAAERPAVNIATYEAGACTNYALQAFERSDVHIDGDHWQIGRSAFRSWEQDGQRHVVAHLDCDVPGADYPLRGRVWASSPATQLPSTAESSGPHVWRPLGVGGAGGAALTAGDWSLDISGRAYHDRNSSTAPLGALGIGHWVWGRVPTPQGERIYYLVWPESPDQAPVAWGFEVGPDGTTQHRTLDVQLEDATRGWFGMRWWQTLRLSADGAPWLLVKQDAPLDDGPFYLRFLTRAATPDGAWHSGVSEGLRPDGRDNWSGPLTQMAVHRPGGANSFWLPLFSGPAESRWSRLTRTTRPRLGRIQTT